MTYPLFERWFAADGDDDRTPARADVRVANHETILALPGDHPDAPVVAALRAGNQVVFEGLVLQHGPELVRLAYAILGDWSDAEDVAQDVMLWLWTNRARWTPRAGVRPYLLRAASNRARNIRTTRESHHQLERRHIAPFLDHVALHLTSDDSEAALWSAIHALPERWRESIMLRYVEGCAFAEVGVVLGVSEDGAKKVVRRALAALRAALAKRER